MAALAQAGIHAGTITASLTTVGAVVASGKMQRVDFIRVTNTTSTARTVSVALHDGTNTRYLCVDYPVAAKGDLASVVNISSSPIWLPAGWTIRAISSAATSLDLIAPYLETSV